MSLSLPPSMRPGTGPPRPPPGRRSDLLPGTRPGVLLDPEPHVAAATIGHVVAGAPLLLVASLSGGDGVDAITVSYLLKAALQKKKRRKRKLPKAGVPTLSSRLWTSL